MSTVSEVIETQIDVRDAAVSQQGFGTPLIAAAHEFWPETVRTFSQLIELVTPPLDVPTDHPIYKIAAALKAQSPSPTQFKVGKRTTLGEQEVELTPTVAAAGSTYNFTIDGTALTASVAAAGTVAQACTAIAAAITAATALEVTATATATEVSVVGDDPGVRHSFGVTSGNISIADITPDPGIEDDLNAIYAADQDWYGLAIDSVGAAEILSAASWAESQEAMLFFATTQDADCKTASVTDVMTQLQAATLQRTIVLWHHRGAEQWACAAWAGKMLPKTPGSANWANKSLSLVDMSDLSDTERGHLKAKNANYYVSVKRIGFTLDGRAAGGRFADITHGLDWFEARLQERVVLLFANNDKVPYTDAGIQLVRSQVDAQILNGITATIVDPAQDWWTSAPAVADVVPADKLIRLLRDVRFQFVLQGAINKALIQGTVLVAAE
jgi:Protein of unknown function (DUF3383)